MRGGCSWRIEREEKEKEEEEGKGEGREHSRAEMSICLTSWVREDVQLRVKLSYVIPVYKDMQKQLVISECWIGVKLA